LKNETNKYQNENGGKKERNKPRNHKWQKKETTFQKKMKKIKINSYTAEMNNIKYVNWWKKEKTFHVNGNKRERKKWT